jgi:hypothetical protein
MTVPKGAKAEGVSGSIETEIGLETETRGREEAPEDMVASRKTTTVR